MTINEAEFQRERDLAAAWAKAEDKVKWQVQVQTDDGLKFDTRYDKLFPDWWPDSQWSWYVRESQARKAKQ